MNLPQTYKQLYTILHLDHDQKLRTYPGNQDTTTLYHPFSLTICNLFVSVIHANNL